MNFTETRKVEVVLIGAGNIGARHLQSLAAYDNPAHVTVIEPNATAQESCRRLYGEVQEEGAPDVTYYEHLDNLPSVADVCILATPASGRIELLREVLSRMQCAKFIIEKVVFQAIDDFKQAEVLLNQHNAKAWVNCPRRQWPIFKKIKASVAEAEKIECTIAGEKFAMACNAIHLLDVFQYLSGCTQIEVDGSEISEPFADDKRVGSLEFTGTLKATTPRGDIFRLTTASTDKPVKLDMTVRAGSVEWLFRQYDKTVEFADAGSGPQRHQYTVDIPYQSQLTADVVRDVMSKGVCDLASIEESSIAHIQMLEAFLSKIEKSTGQRPERCNIT